jgi:hypothetical protein
LAAAEAEAREVRSVLNENLGSSNFGEDDDADACSKSVTIGTASLAGTSAGLPGPAAAPAPAPAFRRPDRELLEAEGVEEWDENEAKPTDGGSMDAAMEENSSFFKFSLCRSSVPCRCR